MNAADRRAIEHECASVVNRYGLAVCRWDLDGFVSLFTPDAIWQRPGVAPLVGHTAIRSFMDSQPGPDDRVMRHVQGGVVVDVVDDHCARVYSQTSVYSAPKAPLPVASSVPAMVVEYEDRMVCAAERWLIARRDTTVVFSA
jgi:hypothetical protein